MRSGSPPGPISAGGHSVRSRPAAPGAGDRQYQCHLRDSIDADRSNPAKARPIRRAPCSIVLDWRMTDPLKRSGPALGSAGPLQGGSVMPYAVVVVTDG